MSYGVCNAPVHVVPTWDGQWAVLDDPHQVMRWKRFWPVYWAWVGRWVQWLPWMWREE